MTDKLISLQAAVDAIEGYFDGLPIRARHDLIELMKQVPSAQPEPRSFSCGQENDMVSRRAAIDAVSEGCQEWRGIFGKCKAKILALPSAQPEQRWIPVTLETLPNPNSVVVVCGKKGTWDYGTYRGWYRDIHSWWWKKNTIKHVYWWMYKTDALPEPYRKDGEAE